MQTHLADRFKDTVYGQQAQQILRACVHCGFCNATCPTYRLLGDELDGPRGRIYLIKQVLEGGPATERTQQHLDRCLTCRNCETTCPSGVQYGRLIDIGRAVVEQQVVRKVADRSLRSALREGLTGSWFAPTLRLGQAFRNSGRSGLLASAPARPPHAADGRVRAAGAASFDQFGHGPRVRCGRHRTADRLRCRMLRSDSPAPDRSPGRAARCPTQHRCLVARARIG